MHIYTFCSALSPHKCISATNWLTATVIVIGRCESLLGYSLSDLLYVTLLESLSANVCEAVSGILIGGKVEKLRQVTLRQCDCGSTFKKDTINKHETRPTQRATHVNT